MKPKILISRERTGTHEYIGGRSYNELVRSFIFEDQCLRTSYHRCMTPDGLLETHALQSPDGENILVHALYPEA
jgi:hypothetical protein